jgi:hypothetical protein
MKKAATRPSFLPRRKRDIEQWVSMLGLVISFGLIVAGAIGLVLLQKPLRDSQDTQSRASVADGQVQVAVQTSNSLTVGQAAVIPITVNTNNLQTDGVQLVFRVNTTTANTLTIQLNPDLNLQAAYQEVEQTDTGFLIGLIATPQTIGQSFSTASTQTLATVSFTPTTAGEVAFVFDNNASKSTLHDSSPVKDELKTIANATATVNAPIDEEEEERPGTGGIVIGRPDANGCYYKQVQCFQAPCDPILICPTPTPTVAPSPTTTPTTYRQCNEGCTSNRECTAGLTCFEGRCRHPLNTVSTSCQEASAQTTQAITKSCNQDCSSNSQCANNLRCYSGKCRLATNVSSLSCSPATTSTITQTYKNTTGKGGDITNQPGNRNATSGGSYTSTRSAVGPKPTVKPGATTTTSGSFLQNLITKWRQQNPTFFLMMIISGLILIALVIVLFILSRLRNSNSNRTTTGPILKAPVAGGSPRPVTPSEQNSLNHLEKELASLRTNTTPAPMPATAPAPQSMRPTVPAPTMPMAAPTTPSDHSMMNRLKNQGFQTTGPKTTLFDKQTDSNS